MKKNFTPLLYMIFPILFFIYLILASISDLALWMGIVGAVLFSPLFLIGLIGTLIQLFKKEKKNSETELDDNNKK